MKVFYLLSLLSALLIGGCAKMNKKECQLANWQLLGIQDGSDGEPMSVFAERLEACTSHGLAVDRAAYVQGRETGLRSYCTPRKGYSEGEYGERYHGVCAGKKEADFLAAYNKGYRIYEQKKVVSELDSEISSLKRTISRKSRDKSKVEADLIVAKTPEDRTRLLLELNRITQSISDARAEQAHLRERRRVEKLTLDNMPRGL